MSHLIVTKLHFNIKFGNYTVLASESVKYLGLFVSYDLSWTSHVLYVISKTSKIIGLFKHKSYFLNQQQKLSVYNVSYEMLLNLGVLFILTHP